MGIRALEQIHPPLNILYPERLYQIQTAEGMDPMLIGHYALKLGVLTQRGFVFQAIGNYSIDLTLDEFDPYPIYDEQIAKKGLGIDIGPKAVEAFAGNKPKHGRYEREEFREMFQLNFQRALTLYERFRHTDSLEIIVNHEIYPATPIGIDQALKTAGYE